MSHEHSAVATKPSYDDLVREMERAAATFQELGTVLNAFGAPRSGEAARTAARAAREIVARARG